MRPYLPALILIALGVVFLLENLGLLAHFSLGHLIRTWWPLVLILLGISMLVRRGSPRK